MVAGKKVGNEASQRRRARAIIKGERFRRAKGLSERSKAKRYAKKAPDPAISSVQGSRRRKQQRSTKITPIAAMLYAHGNVGIPEQWVRVETKMHVAYFHEALRHMGDFVPFTLHLSESIIAKAHASENFTIFIRNRVIDRLKYRFKFIPSYWFVIETHTRLGVKCPPHLHGAISIPKTNEAMSKLRSALKSACGSDYPARGKQCHFKLRDHVKDGTYFFWGGGYVSKWLQFSNENITGKAFARTLDLSRLGRKLYEVDRTAMIREVSEKNWLM